MLNALFVCARVRACITTLFISAIFVSAVCAVTPAITLAHEGVTVDETRSGIGYIVKKKRLDEHAHGHNYYHEQPTYNGNWGYAPGYNWDPNDLWRRSRGFWDTNSPACPFRSC